MDRETLQHLTLRKPFSGFRIRLSTNETFDIKHPEAIYLAKKFVAIARSPAEAANMHEGDMIWIDYDHIVHCHPLPQREIPF